MDNRHTLDQRPVTAADAYRMYRAWSRFGWEMIGRPLESSRMAGERVAESAARGLFGDWAPRSLAEDIAREYANFAFGLLTVPSSSLGSAVEGFDAPDRTAPDEIERALSGTAPAAIAKQINLRVGDAEEQIRFLTERAGNEVVDADLSLLAPRVANRFLLPARVLDASQGWASWFVPVRLARTLMEEAVALGHQPEEILDTFEPVTVGKGEAMVSLVATDYRASDFGVLKEIGLTLSVTPRNRRFPDPGQMFIRLIVTDPYSLVAARRIWGIRKDLWDTHGITPRYAIDAAYHEKRVRFGVHTYRTATVVRPNALEIAFPRFGKGRSDAVPGAIYSMTEPEGLPAKPITPLRTTLNRSGSGEGTQFGGSVALYLPDNREAGKQGGCLCSAGMACLCDTLRDLGLNTRRSAANGWTERMTGTLEEPVPIL